MLSGLPGRSEQLQDGFWLRLGLGCDMEGVVPERDYRAHIHTDIHAYIHTYIHACIYIHTYSHMQKSVCVCIYIEIEKYR